MNSEDALRKYEILSDDENVSVPAPKDSCITPMLENYSSTLARRTPRKAFQSMLQSMNDDDVEISTVFVCRFCGRTFKRKHECIQHETAFHGVQDDEESDFPTPRQAQDLNSVDESNDVFNQYLDDDIPSSIDVSHHSRKRPKISLSQDKENASKDSQKKDSASKDSQNKGNASKEPDVCQRSGYVISYLGKPRFLIADPSSSGFDKSSSSVSNQRNSNKMTTRSQKKIDEESSHENRKRGPIAVILNLEDLCRLCGAYSNLRVPIFGNKQHNFVKMVEDFFPRIKISEEDILSTQICAKCEASLTTWYQFQKECNAANSRFQSMLKRLVDEPDVIEKIAEKKAIKEAKDLEKRIIQKVIVETINRPRNENEKNNDGVEVVNVEPEDPRQEIVRQIAAERRKNKQRLRQKIRRERFRLRPSACPLCDKIFILPETLRRHLNTVHSDKRPFKCPVCPSTFKRNHYLSSHIRSVHLHERNDRPNDNTPHLCDYCGKALRSTNSLRVHINNVHTKDTLFECDTCHSTFCHKSSLFNHLSSGQCLSSSRNKNEERLEVGFPKCCEICGLEFKMDVFYQKHKLKHMTSLTCDMCSAVLSDSNALREHMDTEHPEMTPFQCETCGKRFKTKNFLQKHAIIHSGEKKFECEYCQTRFLKKKYLINHVRRHTGERPFVCTICDRAFTQISEMRIHKARHTQTQIQERQIQRKLEELL